MSSETIHLMASIVTIALGGVTLAKAIREHWRGLAVFGGILLVLGLLYVAVATYLLWGMELNVMDVR